METNPILKYIKFIEDVRKSLVDKDLVVMRHELADFTSNQFLEVAAEITNQESSSKEDKVDKAVSLILRIGSSLISGANDLFKSGNIYAAAALLRQIVEIEYLAWAFEDYESEANKWIISSKEERRKFFTPDKLRKASQGRFRSKDYGYHCELGGHPVPEAELLLKNTEVAQLLLSDMLGHSGRIWDHLVKWERKGTKRQVVLMRNEYMLEKYLHWKKTDPTTMLPPPP